ncbi:PAS domain S-box protein [Fischerella thermalis CCMEE 5268]|uniref:histidine kinase n=1 Tax=Fischerella thermalis CCMEE 5268 TaxID=2019662 RepID=A0A2N6KB47_9CYAN|nr:ATP-binding protein [Fischerella thermalis]PLZ95695.1 PAS domain S-box protein [Fischerella thermalis CCMEE 5268]
MLRRKRRIIWRYGIAVLTVAIALLSKLLLNYWSGQLRETPFLLFFAAIMATSYYGGVGPGILAVVLSSFLGGYFFLTPAKSSFSSDPWTNIQLVIFLVEGLFLVSLIHFLKTYRRNTQIISQKLLLSEDKSRQNQDLLHLIANSLPVCISYIDSQQRYQFINKTYNTWFGFSPEEIYGKHLVEVVGEAAYQIIKDKVERALAGNLVEYEAELPYREGGTRYINAILVPDIAEDGLVRGYCGLVIDISDRKQAELEIKQLNENLEQKVKERTIQLQEVNRELEAFTYTVSHDLRAPLRAMQGLAQALQEDYSSYLDETGQEYTKRIVTAAARMDTLILDLLAYSRLGRSEIWLQRLSLDSAIAEVLKELQPEIQVAQAHITIESPLPIVKAHRTILVQVLINLISNAIKFVTAGVQPQVRIRAEERVGEEGVQGGQGGQVSNLSSLSPHTPPTSPPPHLPISPPPHRPISSKTSTCKKWVRLWVEDNGIGIANQHQERIFRTFERLHGIESYPGTGIGLAIIKRGIERMGGGVGVESQLGQGSRFWIELPQGDSSSK